MSSPGENWTTWARSPPTRSPRRHDRPARSPRRDPRPQRRQLPPQRPRPAPPGAARKLIGPRDVDVGRAVVEMKTGSGLFRRLAPWLEPGFLTFEHMTIQRMEHVGIVVDDLAAATEFFVELGLELQGEGPVEGRWVDRVVGLDGVRAEIAILQ